MSDQALMILVPLAFVVGVTGFVVYMRRDDRGQSNDWFWNILTIILSAFDD